MLSEHFTVRNFLFLMYASLKKHIFQGKINKNFSCTVSRCYNSLNAKIRSCYAPIGISDPTGTRIQADMNAVL